MDFSKQFFILFGSILEGSSGKMDWASAIVLTAVGVIIFSTGAYYQKKREKLMKK